VTSLLIFLFPEKARKKYIILIYSTFVNFMKKTISLILSLSILSNLPAEERNVGSASSHGVSSANVAWAVIGTAFLIGIGIAVAITISND